MQKFRKFFFAGARRIRSGRVWAFSLAAVVFSLSSVGRAETVSIPMKVDYPLLAAIYKERLYTDPGDVATVVDEDNGCRRITLTDPSFSAELPHVVFGTVTEVFWGASFAGKCRFQIHWKGYTEYILQPKADPKNWRVKFSVVDTRVLGEDRQPTRIVSRIWNLIKGQINPNIEAVTVDMSFPKTEAKELLWSMLVPETRQIVARWMDTARPGKLAVTETGLVYPILIDVKPEELRAEKIPERPVTPEETDRAVAAWEAWDSYLTAQITALARTDLTGEDQEILTSVLLDSRHQFVALLASGNPPAMANTTREQFMSAWEQLSPVFRKHLVKGKGTPLRKLALFSAQDALATLDKLGPALGVEISRDGLARLVRLLAAEGEEAPSLEYGYETSEDLRLALGMGESLPEPPPPSMGEDFDPEGIEEVPDQGAGLISAIEGWWLGTAWGAEGDPNTLSVWIPLRNPADAYLARVRGVLDAAMEKLFVRGQLDESRHDFFQKLTLASAWQESCWRQFIVKKGKVSYLKSYNNTSVGLMQINERVWRKLYNRAGLRWNPEYNARAGVEILDLYLRRYALGKTPDEESLSGAVYAMYNSGPGDLKKFIWRKAENRLYVSDQGFQEKYDFVLKDRWDHLTFCIGYR